MANTKANGKRTTVPMVYEEPQQGTSKPKAATVADLAAQLESIKRELATLRQTPTKAATVKRGRGRPAHPATVALRSLLARHKSQKSGIRGNQEYIQFLAAQGLTGPSAPVIVSREIAALT